MSNSSLIDSLVDLDADYYVKNSFLQNCLAKNILDGCRLNQRAHILDVGCGDGRITAELAQRVPDGEVIGLDPSPSMIEYAARAFPKKKFPNLDFQLGMAEDTTFSEQFDLIVSFSCFHWLKDPCKAISRLCASLKQGGEMLILTYPKESPYYRYLQMALKNYPAYCHLSANNTMLTVNEYKKTLAKHGLKILHFTRKKMLALYNNPKEIQQYVRGWLNNYIQLPEYLNDSFLKEVSNAVISDPAAHKGKKIAIPYTSLVIKARK